ncbi:phosphatidylserine decarboxylase [Massilia atriviolacea]|uniref:phosphatidylserine decarboxylase n=1 Tax=Massilia atriviolacea TaxID=2495579 RepID=UPI0013E06BD9|nr:phosphatidylserine decarboxylase [Massilia atriviolacea]
MSGAPILLHSRASSTLVAEQVFERGFMDFFYGSRVGLILSELLLKRRWFSRAYGASRKRAASRRQIDGFVRQYGIDLSEVELPVEDYRSFNDFFTRRLKPGARPLPADCKTLASPADARVLAWDIVDGLVVPVKSRAFTVAQLLGDDTLAHEYWGGTCCVLRLAPADYHRFIHIDRGTQGPVRRINGYLHSVSPLALRNMLAVFTENAREYCRIETEQFGPVIHVDVGAMVVGRIVQHRPEGGPVERGEEKGYFEFGGSTVILLFKAGAVELDADIRSYSAQGIETIVLQGERIGRSSAS